MALPKVYILTESQIKKHAPDLNLEEKVDLVAQCQSTIESMIKRPAMYVGRDDLKLLIPMLHSELSTLGFYVNSLGFGVFMDGKRLGAQGMNSLLRRRVRCNDDDKDNMPLGLLEELPKEEVRQVLQKFASDYFEWLEDHIVMFKQFFELPERERPVDRVDLSLEEVAHQAKQQWDMRLRDAGLTWGHVAWQGLYYQGNFKVPRFILYALEKPYKAARVWMVSVREGRDFLNKLSKSPGIEE